MSEGTQPDDELEQLLKESLELAERQKKLEERKKYLLAEAAAYAEEAEREKEAARLAKEREKPVTLTVNFISAGMVFFTNEFRDDLLKLLQATPGRQWNGTHNAVPVKGAEEFFIAAEKLGNVRIKITRALEDEMDWWLHAPPWHVTVHPSKRHLLCHAGPQVVNRHLLTPIPGAEWDESSKSWKLPLSEGWRIYKILERVQGVKYSDEAGSLILAQVEKRSRLDQLTGMQDTEDERLKILTRMVTMPSGVSLPFWKALLPFQRVGTVFGLESGVRLLNGDDTGLGKTWQAYAMSEVLRLTDVPTCQTVIVCKAGNIRNWVREGERLTGVTPLVCKGGKPDFFMIQEIVTKRHPYVVISHDTLGTYTFLPEEEEKEKPEETYTWANIFKVSGPDVLIVDEAHAIKTPDTHRSRATRKLSFIPRVILLTASPILNRTEELWPLLYMLDPQTFKSHDQFVNTYTFNGRQPRNVGQLHDLMKPVFIRRRKSEVQKDLPPINRITTYHDLSPKALKAYDKVLQGIYEEMDTTFDPLGKGEREFSVVNILSQIQRLKMVCAADTTDTTVEQAEAYIEEHPDDKVLIFTQYKGTCDTIRRKLGHAAVGTVKRTPAGFVSLLPDQRDKLFEEARHDPKIKYIVAMANASSGLEGHNIEFCGCVIFNDLLWTPKGHDQCEGRAYGRLSNPHAINSVYVVADTEIIRWIMELLEKKLAIIQHAIDNIETARDIHGSIGRELIQKIKDALWQGSRRGR